MLSNRSGGSITREEARHQQHLQYEQDAKKYAEKQKIKEEKKKAEKWKKYSHIDLGERLSPRISTSSNTNTARQEQNRYDLEGMYGYIEQLERENARLKRAEEKHKEKLNKLAQLNTGETLKSDVPKVKKSSEDSSAASGVTFGDAVKDELPIPLCSSSSFNGNERSDLTGSQFEELDKEEQYRREMRRAREKMQMLYTNQVKNVTD